MSGPPMITVWTCADRAIPVILSRRPGTATVPAGTWNEQMMPSVLTARVAVSQNCPPKPVPSAAVVFVATAGVGLVEFA